MSAPAASKADKECTQEMMDSTAEASEWQQVFAEDVRGLASEILVHICGDSCYKYSGTKVDRICRHGYYSLCNLGDWENVRKESVSAGAASP